MNRDLQNFEGMHETLSKRVREYFTVHQKSIRDAPTMYIKVLFFLSLSLGTYIFLVFSSKEVIYHFLAAIFLSILLSGIVMNVIHDSNHFAISKYQYINKFFSFSSDLIGVSSFLWRCFHNNIHHRNPNVMGKDQDLELTALLRYGTHKKKRAFHAYQMIYMWLLFPLGVIVKPWRDFENLYYKIKTDPLFLSKNKYNIMTFIFFKFIFFLLAFIIPLQYYSLTQVLLFNCLIYGLMGLILVPIFHVGHMNEKTKFFYPSEVSNYKYPNFLHQIEATANFATNNIFLNWYLGGLNFQIEHHLFPYICHVHYPAISKIIKQTCDEFNITYNIFPTFSQALASHCRWLRKLGRA